MKKRFNHKKDSSFEAIGLNKELAEEFTNFLITNLKETVLEDKAKSKFVEAIFDKAKEDDNFLAYLGHTVFMLSINKMLNNRKGTTIELNL